MKNARCEGPRHTHASHHAVSSQKIRDDLLVYVVHQASGTLVVVAGVDEKLLAGIFVDERTHLAGKLESQLSNKVPQYSIISFSKNLLNDNSKETSSVLVTHHIGGINIS